MGDGQEQAQVPFYMSIYQKAKDKTVSTLSMVKQDLSELGEAIRDEGSNLLQATTNVLRDQAGHMESAGNVLRQLADSVGYVFFEKDTSEGEEQFERPILVGNAMVNYNRLDLEPSGDPKEFAKWLQSFALSQHEEQLELLLVNDPALRDAYEKLVPREIDRLTFWQHYFYMLHQVDQESDRGLARAGCSATEGAVSAVEEKTSDVDTGENPSPSESFAAVDAECESFLSTPAESSCDVSVCDDGDAVVISRKSEKLP